jgi:hypothetical protein
MERTDIKLVIFLIIFAVLISAQIFSPHLAFKIFYTIVVSGVLKIIWNNKPDFSSKQFGIYVIGMWWVFIIFLIIFVLL